MSGIPVVISSHGGIPVRQVTSGAPVMTVATNGFGIPIVLSNRGLPFVVQGLAPAPSWSVQPSISGTPQVGQTLTGNDGTIANGTVTLRQWLNAADNSVLGTGSTLLLTEAMEGLNIKFKVTAVGTGGSATATSTQVGPVTEAAAGVVEIAPNDALSRFEISNTASFPGGTWTWYDDAGAQVGTVTTPYLLYSAVPTGKLVKARANGNAATDSILWGVPQNNIVWSYDGATSTIPDGTDFASVTTGWTGTTGKTDISGGHIRVTSFAFPGPTYTRNVPTAAYKISGRFNRGITTTVGDSTNRTLFVNYIDSNNWVALRSKYDAAYLEKTVGGVYTFVSGVGSGNNPDSYEFEISSQIIGGQVYVQVSRNGVRYDAGGPGTLIAGLTPTARVGFSFGNGTDASNPSYPFNVAYELEVESIPTVGLTVTSFSFVGPTSGSPASIAFIGTTDYAAIQAVVLAEDGHELGGITSFTGLTPGAMSLSIPNPPEGMLQTAFLRIRQTSNTNNYVDYPLGTLPYYDAVDAREFGINFGNVGSSGFNDVVKDRGLIASWRYSGSSGLMNIPDSDKNSDGWPLNVPMPAGYDTARLAVLFEGSRPGTRVGPWKFKILNGVTGAITTYADNMSVSGLTTSEATFTVTDASAPRTGWVSFPASIVPPAGGLKISCTVVGEVDDGNRVTPELADIWGASAFPTRRSIRLMKTTGADGPREGAGFETIASAAGTKEFASDLTWRLGEGTDIHYVFPWNDVIARKATRVTPVLEYFRDNARPGSKLIFSGGNEVWNPFYKNQFCAMAAAGFNAGFMPSVTIPSGVTVTNQLYTADGNPTGGVEEGGLTRRTFNPNETFTCRATDYQYGLYQCISATPVAAGYTIPQLGDANFARLTPYGGIFQAARRYQGEVTKQLAIEARAILGDRAVSNYEVWIDDSAELLRDFLMFNDTWQYADEVSPSFYAGESVTYGTFSWHSQYASNFAAFKAGMIARETTTWATTRAKLIDIKHRLPKLLIEAGVPRDQVCRMRRPYEGGSHNGIFSVPGGDIAGFITAGQNVIRSAEYAATTTQIQTDYATYCGGPAEWFMDAEPFWYNYGGAQMQWFGLLECQFPGAWNANGANERRYLATRAVFGT